MFTNTRKLSQRVQSFGRTFTANSTTEPSWLSRVKHIGDEKSDPEKASGENEKGGALGLGHNPTETGEETGEANSTNGSNNASGSDTAVDSPSGADDHPHGDAMKSTKDDQRDHAPEVWQEGDVVSWCLYACFPADLAMIACKRGQPRGTRQSRASIPA